MIVAEFDYAGTVIATGAAFTVPCVFVLRVRDGLIVESRDYIDHVAMARARGQLEELVGYLREPAAADSGVLVARSAETALVPGDEAGPGPFPMLR